MINFVLGMFLMWFILAELICVGSDYLKQECNWESWWILIICFPAVIIQSSIDLIPFIIKIVKNYHSKKPKSK